MPGSTPPLGRTAFPNGIQLGSPAIGLENQAYPAMLITLADPVVASVNRLVVSVNMANGAYTIANGGVSADALARNVTVSATDATGADTKGSVLITGLDINGAVITEAIVPVGGSTVAGLKAFKSVTTAVQSGWVISGGNDTITIGFGTVIGLPIKLRAATAVVLAFINNAIAAATVVASGDTSPDQISSSTVDMSASTYDGVKDIVLLVRS